MLFSHGADLEINAGTDKVEILVDYRHKREDYYFLL
jgi:hypothetical protein